MSRRSLPLLQRGRRSTLVIAASTLLVAGATQPALPAHAAGTSYQQISLSASVTGTSVVTRAVVTASRTTTVKDYKVCVRDARDQNLDFGDTLPAPIVVKRNQTSYVSQPQTYAPGTYSYFVCVNDGTWHNVGVLKRFTVRGDQGVTIKAISSSASSATVTWTRVPGATGYRVGRDGKDAIGVGPWQTTDASSVSSQTFIRLRAKTTYTLFVQPLPDGARRTIKITTLAGTKPTPKPSPQPSGHGRVGVMINLDPGDPAAFPRDLSALRASGSSWTRMAIAAGDAGGIWNGRFVPNKRNMAFYTSAFRQTKQAGLKIVLVMADAQNDNAWSDQQFRDYNKQYWAAVSAAVGSYVDLVEVFNEADGADFRNYSGVGASPSTQYLQRLKAALQTARSAWREHSRAPLTTCPYGYPIDEAMYSRWVRFFDVMNATVDVIGVHAYAEENPVVIGRVPTYMNRLKARYHKPVAVLEYGLPSVAGYGTASQVGAGIVAQTRAILSADPFCATLYQLRDRGTNQKDGEQMFGLLRINWSAKAYNSAVVAVFRANR